MFFLDVTATAEAYYMHHRDNFQYSVYRYFQRNLNLKIEILKNDNGDIF